MNDKDKDDKLMNDKATNDDEKEKRRDYGIVDEGKDMGAKGRDAKGGKGSNGKGGKGSEREVTEREERLLIPTIMDSYTTIPCGTMTMTTMTSTPTTKGRHQPRHHQCTTTQRHTSFLCILPKRIHCYRSTMYTTPVSDEQLVSPTCALPVPLLPNAFGFPQIGWSI